MTVDFDRLLEAKPLKSEPDRAQVNWGTDENPKTEPFSLQGDYPTCTTCQHHKKTFEYVPDLMALLIIHSCEVTGKTWKPDGSFSWHTNTVGMFGCKSYERKGKL